MFLVPEVANSLKYYLRSLNAKVAKLNAKIRKDRCTILCRSLHPLRSLRLNYATRL